MLASLTAQNDHTRPGRKAGMALFGVLATLTGLALLSSTVFLLTSTDIGIAANHRREIESFYQADAAVHYVRSRIEADLAAGRITLSNANEQVSYYPPAGMDFDPVTNLMRTADGRAFFYRVTGRSRTARSTIEVTFYRTPKLGFGVFGDQLVDMKAYGNVYSYYSSRTPTPIPTDSTGEADSGGNNDFITHVGTYLDGSLVLGEDEYGNPAIWYDPGSGSVVTGDGGVTMDHVISDPLGAIGGPLAVKFAEAAFTNNNANAIPAITSDKINLGAGQTMTLPTGNYYLSGIELNNSATLTIDASAGPVNIYLTGGANFKNGCSVNIIGQPPDFSLYSNSSATLLLYNSSSFKGLIYAPYADIQIDNSGNFYGVVWGDEVELKNSGDCFIDMTLINRLVGDDITLFTWKEVR